MIFWLILAVYLVGWAVSTVYAARQLREAAIRVRGVQSADRQRVFDLWTGCVIATIWPVSVLIILFLTWSDGRIMAWIMRTETERIMEHNRRVEEIRGLAKANGLPYPGETR